MTMAPQTRDELSAFSGKRDCPVCGREVSVRASDGRIRAHRVGRGVDERIVRGGEGVELRVVLQRVRHMAMLDLR